jgi:hypothetical protein
MRVGADSTSPILLRIAIIVAVLLQPITTFAYLGPLPPKPDRLWFTLFPDSPIVSGADYAHALDCSEAYDRDSGAFLLQMRAQDTMQILATAYLSGVGTRTYSPLPPDLPEDDQRMVQRRLHPFAKLPPGKFVCAIILDGERVSNVAEFEVDPDFDIARRPVLELAPIEATPYSGLPAIGVRINGSEMLEDTFRFSQVVDADIDVDEIPRGKTILIWGGLDPEIVKGSRRSFIAPIDGFRSPEIEPNVAHKARLNFMTYQSNEIELKPERTLGERWDKAAEQER